MTALDDTRLRDLFAAAGLQKIDRLEVFDEIDSTNTYLLDQLPAPAGHFRVAVADHQTAGRGRSENRWISMPGRSLCLSLAYTFAKPPQQMASLTLALGVGAAEVLHSLGAEQVRLKWPNDLLVGDAKLGGILTEAQHRRKDEIVAVAGIGLNVAMPGNIEVGFDSTCAPHAIDLESILPRTPAREDLTLQLVRSWCSTIRMFESEGFAPFLGRFAALDWLHGKNIRVATGTGSVDGIAFGVSESGALQVETHRGLTELISGSIVAARAL